MHFLRSLLFYCGYITSTICWGTFAAFVGLFLPLNWRYNFVIPPWTGFVIWWLQITCNIAIVVKGAEHLDRSKPGILFFKHQSSFDALYSTLLVKPQSTIIKKGLLWIPCFGWAFAVTKPITIDRKQRLAGMRKIVDEGVKQLAKQNWVTIFPEGTRVKAGLVGKFMPGGAMLAAHSKAPVHVVAHNGGRHWLLNRFTKLPGVIEVRISPPITTTDLSPAEINASCEQWMRANMLELDPPVDNEAEKSG